jgi:hypothetical protein
MFRELETGDTDLGQLSPAPSVLDMASLLKQFLRYSKLGPPNRYPQASFKTNPRTDGKITLTLVSNYYLQSQIA